MSKGKIITFSIIGIIVVLIGVLFGGVFCLREQKVVVVGENIVYSADEIVETAGLKQGRSIFLLDKDTAINNIEKKYADLKVIQIKTTSVTEIEIRVRKRYETYYVKNLGQYYVLDEDLKVLNIVLDEDIEKIAEIENLVKIPALTNLNEKTTITSFVGNEIEKNICYNLYTAVYTTQMKDEVGADAHNEFANLITGISFDKGYTASGEAYNRVIVKTSSGMTFDIGKADSDLQRKINICFATLNSDDVTDKTGTLSIRYNELGEEIINYTKAN